MAKAKKILSLAIAALVTVGSMGYAKAGAATVDYYKVALSSVQNHVIPKTAKALETKDVNDVMLAMSAYRSALTHMSKITDAKKKSEISKLLMEQSANIVALKNAVYEAAKAAVAAYENADLSTLEKVAAAKALKEKALAEIAKVRYISSAWKVALEEKVTAQDTKVAAAEANLAVLKIESVSAITAKSLKVKFSKAVDTTKVVLTVKKNAVALNVSKVEWNEAKTEATIIMVSKFTKGDYTVNVSGVTETALTSTITIEDEKVAKIELNNTAILDRTDDSIVTVPFKVYNQYNEDITTSVSGLVATVGVAVHNSTPSFDYTNKVIKIDATSSLKAGDKIAISVIDPATSTFASTTLTVADKAQVAEVAIKSLYNENGATLDVNSSVTDFYLVVELKDQYGNSVDADTAENDVIVTVSNPSVVDVAKTGNTPNFTTMDINDDGENETVLQLSGGLTAGTSKVTLISKTTGKTASYDVVVKEAAKVDTLTLSQPELAVAGEEVEIPFTAFDQFGKAVTKADDLNRGLSITASNSCSINFVQDYVNNKAKLVLNLRGLADETTVVITAVTGTNKVVQLTVPVKKPATPVIVSGITNTFVPNVIVGGTTTLKLDNLIIKDQYGRTMKSSDVASLLGSSDGDYRVYVTSSATSKVNIDANVIDASTDVLTLTGVAKGSATITVKLQKFDADYDVDGEWLDVSGSTLTFTAKTVDISEIASFELADFGKLYENAPATSDYAQPVRVYGVMADGKKVVLTDVDGADYYDVIINDAYVSYDRTEGTIASTPGYDSWGTDKERTVAVIVTVKGSEAPVILTKNITVSNVTPKIVSVALNSDDADFVSANTLGLALTDFDDKNSNGRTDEFEASVLTKLVATDNYGVESTPDAGDIAAIINTNFTKNADGTSKTLDTVAAGDSFTTTIITKSGVTFTFKVIVK